MKLHRYIGFSELEALHRDGRVDFIPPKRKYLYFFEEENYAPQYQLQYLWGIVGFLKSADPKYSEYFIVLHLDLPVDKQRDSAIKPYADPDGAFFDTIEVRELHAPAYALGDVRTIDVIGCENIDIYRKIKSFDNIDDCIVWLDSNSINAA